MAIRRWAGLWATVSLSIATLFCANLAIGADAHIARVTILYDAFGKSSRMEKDWGYSAFVEYGGKLSRLNLFRTGTIVSSGTAVLPGTWHFDFDAGGFSHVTAVSLVAITYNNQKVSEADIPKTWQGLLDPKWSNKIALGERAVQADGADSNLLLLKEQGAPVEAAYATEGTPLITAPSCVFQSAPNPNAARLFQSFLFSVEAQQSLVDASALHSFHALAKEKPGRRPLSTIKLLKTDTAAMEAERFGLTTAT